METIPKTLRTGAKSMIMRMTTGLGRSGGNHTNLNTEQEYTVDKDTPAKMSKQLKPVKFLIGESPNLNVFYNHF